MEVDIGKFIKNVSQIKLGGGIFTKASIVIIVVSSCICLIAVITHNIWVSCGAISLIFILSFVMLWRLIDFAHKNPQAAILEGAQFLVHEQIQLAAKGIDSIPQSLSSLIEDLPIPLDPTSQQLANEPDKIEKSEKEEENG